ncbi:Uncharacterised protein [Chlamydia trachomatis]|nr:Uncharacterised protein [Chlamydia trachomatis]
MLEPPSAIKTYQAHACSTSVLLRGDQVNSDCENHDETLDGLLPCGVDCQNRQTHVQNAHDECTDDGTGDLTDTTRDRSTTDKGCCDSVEFVVVTCGCDCSTCTGGRDDAGECGKEAHVHEDQEVSALGVDTGQLGCAEVATNGVDVTTELRLRHDERVDDHQNADDDENDRGPTGGQGEQVGHEGDCQGYQDLTGDEQSERNDRCACLDILCATAERGEERDCDRCDTDNQSDNVNHARVAEERGQGSGCDGHEARRQTGNGCFHEDDREATEDEHATQGDDECRNANVGNPEALPATDQDTEKQADDHCKWPRNVHLVHEQCNHATDEGDDRADSEVDVAGDDDHGHADGQDHHVCVLLNQRGDIVRGQKAATGEDVEQDDNDDERAENPVLLEAALQPFGRLFHRASFTRSLVMSFMRDSCVASAAGTTPVITPWLIV